MARAVRPVSSCAKRARAPVGNTARSRWALATSRPTYRGVDMKRCSLRTRPTLRMRGLGPRHLSGLWRNTIAAPWLRTVSRPRPDSGYRDSELTVLKIQAPTARSGEDVGRTFKSGEDVGRTVRSGACRV